MKTFNYNFWISNMYKLKSITDARGELSRLNIYEKKKQKTKDLEKSVHNHLEYEEILKEG